MPLKACYQKTQLSKAALYRASGPEWPQWAISGGASGPRCRVALERLPGLAAGAIRVIEQSASRADIPSMDVFEYALTLP